MIPRPVALLAALVLLPACSGESQVGSQDNLDFQEQDGGRVGAIERTTPPAAAPTTAAPRPSPQARRTTAAPARTRPASTRPSTAAAATFTIRIVSTGQGFDPFNFAVTKGTRLRVLNTDSTARTFTSDVEGAFDSGPIPPGGSFTYVATKPGTYNFHDETRPFAVGRMEVRG